MRKIRILKITVFSLLLLFFGFCTDDDPIVQYKLTTECTPTESGSVSPSSGLFDDGMVIQLTATPSSEYVFKNWSDGATGTENPVSVIMNTDKNITAIFEKKNYQLNIVIVGEGTVTEEIIQAKSAEDYPSGTIVKLTAIPSEEWEFVEWSGNYQGTENPLQITIDKPTSLTVKFKESLSKKTYVPDDNFEQALIDLGYDEVLDNYVNTDKIDEIIELSIISKNISDLTGIEDFIGLTRLYCSANQLTNLDVSNNIALTYIWCNDNQLTSLDVSKNTALTSLYCGDNLLNSLNVTNNLALNSLHCERNQFTILDVSNNTALAEFNCEKNMLTILDVSNNIELIYLNFNNNQLTTLDISNNTNLYTLDCSNNQLTSLNVSNNALLGTIPFFSFLDCTNNQIDCIQVSQSQLDNISINWSKDDSASYSLDCN